MSCLRPLKAYRTRDGGVAFGTTPGELAIKLELPCGQCIGCRVDRSREWAVRCCHENSLHEDSCFVTLTYSPKFFPPDGGLRVKDWQNFAKRLRRRKGKFRFLHCGEYGDENKRPHYHAIIFGHDFWEDRKELQTNKRGEQIWTSKELEDIWGMGFCTIGSVSFASAAYVARYVLKKVTGDRAAKQYERVDGETGEVYQIQPEYATMSRRPGLGASWFEKYSADVYPSDEVIINGKKFRPPRYYDKLMEAKDKSFMDGVRKKRIESLKPENMTPERMAVRERSLEARLKNSNARKI